MDPNAMVEDPSRVEGGANGLDRAAELLRDAGFPILGVYLIAINGETGDRSWYMRIVSDAIQHAVLFKAIQLRRQGAFPKLSESVSLSPMRSNHPEASRILQYARKFGSQPCVIDGQILDGLYVDYALVGSSVLAAV